MHPVTPLSTQHQALRASASRAIMVAESEPRQSRLHYIVRTTGLGETRLTGSRALKFDMFLINEPAFSFGVVADGLIPDKSLPLASAIVLKYLQNDNELYVGAELGFLIQPNDFGKAHPVPLRWMLAFESAAFRSTAGIDSALGVELDGPNYYSGG